MSDMKSTLENGGDSADDVGPLIRLAGARETVSPERFREAHRRVASHWQAVVAKRRQRRARQFVALAASVVGALTLGVLMWRAVPETPHAPVAAVTRVTGEVYSNGEPAVTGGSIPRGAMVQTTDGARIALALENGQTMRIDRQSRLVALGDSRFRLEQGAVYVDSAGSAPSASVFIETVYGVASDVGTQFQVRVAADGLTVGVRDGLVAIERAGAQPVSVPTGRLYRLAPSGEEGLTPYDRDGSLWAWVATIAPAFDLDGATLSDYLRWYASERGLALHWSDAVSESRADGIRLSGSLEGLSLEDGIDMVSRIAPFEYERHDDALLIRVE